MTGTLHAASFPPPNNWTALAPKVAARRLNHVSKVTWMGLELKLVCVQSVSSDHRDALCIQGPPHPPPHPPTPRRQNVAGPEIKPPSV